MDGSSLGDGEVLRISPEAGGKAQEDHGDEADERDDADDDDARKHADKRKQEHDDD